MFRCLISEAFKCVSLSRIILGRLFFIACLAYGLVHVVYLLSLLYLAVVLLDFCLQDSNLEFYQVLGNHTYHSIMFDLYYVSPEVCPIHQKGWEHQFY